MTKPKKQKINVRLLRRIQKQILKEPRQFIMSRYFAHSQRIPNCNTAACIAGWAIALKEGITPKAAANSFVPYSDGQDALGLTINQAERLFLPANWPNRFLLKPSHDPHQAVARIEAFIKSNGRI